MPLSSWQLCLLSDRKSVIKCDSLSFLTQTLTQIPHKVWTPPPQITHSIHFGSLYSSHMNCYAVDSPWRKHKSWKQPDMTETSPWLWWVTTGAKQQWAAVAETASESLRDELRWCYTHQAQWQLWWIGFVSFFFFFFQATTHSVRAATELQ